MILGPQALIFPFTLLKCVLLFQQLLLLREKSLALISEVKDSTDPRLLPARSIMLYHQINHCQKVLISQGQEPLKKRGPCTLNQNYKAKCALWLQIHSKKTIFSLHFHHYPEGYNERQCHINGCSYFYFYTEIRIASEFRKRRKDALRTLPRSQMRKAEDQRKSRGPRSNFEFS